MRVVVELTRRDPTFMFVIDDPAVVDQVEEAAGAAKVKARVAAAVFAGLTRQGIANGQPALELAQKIHSSKNIQLEGFMAYSGGASHTHGWEARRKKSTEDLSGVQETVALAKKAGLPIGIITGGSTGTYNIDHALGLTELECGSYVFMDSKYNEGGRQVRRPRLHRLRQRAFRAHHRGQQTPCRPGDHRLRQQSADPGDRRSQRHAVAAGGEAGRRVRRS